MGVGAGILGLRLHEVLLGTVPILLYVVPCVMSGSFFLRRADGANWDSLFKLVVVWMSVASSVFQLVAIVAVQHALDKNYDRLITPALADVELHWLDYRTHILRNVGFVAWKEVPKCLRFIGLAATAAQIFLLHVIYWGG